MMRAASGLVKPQSFDPAPTTFDARFARRHAYFALCSPENKLQPLTGMRENKSSGG